MSEVDGPGKTHQRGEAKQIVPQPASPSESRRRLGLGIARAGPAPEGGRGGIADRQAARDPLARLTALQTSARGWQTAQVAILGLLGIAGVARDSAQLESLPVA